MANKKINQLVLKTTIQSTDLFPLGDPTTGQLFKKTVAELQAAIGGAVISVNGLVGTVVLDTDDIQELATPTNRYFTEARARAAISLTTTGNSGASTYSNSTGVLNVPTYTLAGLGGITASFLSGGTGITYNSGTGVIAYSGTVYTDASIRALFSAGTGISYNSSTGAITNSAPDQVVSIAGGTGITVSGTYPSFTVAYSGTIYTDSSVRALFSGTAPITYNSSTGAIGITQASGSTNGFLSSTDYTTFNNKQSTITLTTTGTSGAATFSSGTLNIPQYQAVLTNPVTGTGTTNYVTKWTSSSAIGNSQIFDNGTNVGVGTASPLTLLTIGNSATQQQPYLSLARTATGGYFAGIRWYDGTTVKSVIQEDGDFNLRFSTSNSERFRIASGGNIEHSMNDGGITFYKADRTTLKASLANPDGSNTDEGALYLYKANSTKVQLRANGNSYFTGGNVGISNTSPDTAYDAGSWFTAKGLTIGNTSSVAGLQIVSSPTSTLSSIRFGDGSDSLYDQGFINYIHNTDRLVFGANRNTSIVITSSNNILLGTTSDNGERLYVSGSIRATGSITANSDARLKKNIERIENALEKVGQISGYTYNTIYDEDRHAGVIAQEIDKVLPEIVNKGNDGLMGVEYGNISALLIEAIKDLKKDNESLRAIVEGLSK